MWTAGSIPRRLVQPKLDAVPLKQKCRSKSGIFVCLDCQNYFFSSDAKSFIVMSARFFASAK